MTFRYAGFWLRGVALLLDIIFLNLIFYTLQVTAAMVSWDLLSSPVFPFLFLLTYWLYFAGLESSLYQGTVGKRLVSLRVTTLEGYPITFRQATRRHFGKILSVLPLGAGFLMLFSNDKRQTLHDLISDCLVLRS